MTALGTIAQPSEDSFPVAPVHRDAKGAEADRRSF